MAGTKQKPKKRSGRTATRKQLASVTVRKGPITVKGVKKPYCYKACKLFFYSCTLDMANAIFLITRHRRTACDLPVLEGNRISDKEVAVVALGLTNC